MHQVSLWADRSALYIEVVRVVSGEPYWSQYPLCYLPVEWGLRRSHLDAYRKYREMKRSEACTKSI